MAGDGPASGDKYTPVVGLVYIFNLIVGTGALTMPKAFSEAGWLLSILLVLFLAFMSYLTATFMIESMAAANAIFVHESEQSTETDSPVKQKQDETVPLIQTDGVFRMEKVFEMGGMAAMFYNRWGIRLLYLCVAIYLYGDLAIFATAVAKSLRDVICTKDACFGSANVSRSAAYRILLVSFFLTMNPFTFFNVQKTKYLQFLTTFLRWSAFSTMIGICLSALISGKGEGTPVASDLSELPSLIGVCVYAFMCHHSLPSLITPIEPKKGFYRYLAAVFVMILAFYYLLALTGIFTFAVVNDMFTLNFKGHDRTPDVIQYFLALFPVVALSSNYPIVAITLTNNLRSLFLNDQSSWVLQKIIVPLAALIPPFIISMTTENVSLLVSITGGYAGAMIQYVIPATLVYASRKRIAEAYGSSERNPHESPFKQTFWIVSVLVWTALSIIFVSMHEYNRLFGSGHSDSSDRVLLEGTDVVSSR